MTAAERLRRSTVLIAGVGGLGCPAALHLATAGIGTLRLVDADTVELSNLHRQMLYRTADVHRPKVEVAAARLTGLNPVVRIEPVRSMLTADNFADLVAGADFLIDGTDRIASKYLINDGAILNGIALSHAGVAGFQAQTFTVRPRRSACLRCVFPAPPSEGDVPACQDAGVLGPFAGMVGILQAAEAVKYLTGCGTLLTDRLLTLDATTTRWRVIPLARNPHCILCGEVPAIRSLHTELDGSAPLDFR